MYYYINGKLFNECIIDFAATSATPSPHGGQNGAFCRHQTKLKSRRSPNSASVPAAGVIDHRPGDEPIDYTVPQPRPRHSNATSLNLRSGAASRGGKGGVNILLDTFPKLFLI